MVHEMRLHYLRMPEREGRRPLLLLHGFLDIARTWDFVLDRLDETWDPVALDFRGFGDSGHALYGAYSFPYYLLDVLGLLDHLGWERFSVVGHSMGGGVAAMLAGTIPERVERLVVVEGLGPPDMPPETAPEMLVTWLRQTRAAYDKRITPYKDLDAVVEKLQNNNPGYSREVARYLAHYGTRRRDDGSRVWKFDPHHRSMMPLPYRLDQAMAFWRRVSAPTLHIFGEKGYHHIWPDRAARMGAFPHAREALVPDAFHMVHHDNLDGFMEVLVPFLEERV